MSVRECDSLAAHVHADNDSLQTAAVSAGGTHVALLEMSTVDEWHYALGQTGPTRRHYISVDDTVRGTAIEHTPPRAIGGGMFVSVLERPVSDPMSVVADAFEGTDGGSLVVDDPSFLVADSDDPEASIPTLEAVAADAGAELHVGLPDDPKAAAVVSRTLTPADDACAKAVADAGLRHLRETDPTNFGYLRSHWREARLGLEAVEMTYPQAKQVHASLPDPETTPRTLGAALGALVTLGALDIWGDTVAANRYDLTGYDPERVAAIGTAVESLAD